MTSSDATRAHDRHAGARSAPGRAMALRRSLAAGAACALAVGLIALAGPLLRTSAPASPAGALQAADASIEADAAGPTIRYEVEPNDTVAEAQRLPAPPVEVVAAWHLQDRDLFRVVVDEPGGHSLHVWVDGPAGLRLAVGREGREVRAAAVSPGRVVVGVGPGTWLIAIDGGAGAEAGPYRLHVRTVPWTPGTEWEPNDTPETASRLARLPASTTVGGAQHDARAGAVFEERGEPIAAYGARGWWSRSDDVDCYAVPLQVPPAGAVLGFELAPPPTARATLWVLDAGDPGRRIPRSRLASASSRAPGEPAIVPSVGGRSWEREYVACTSANGDVDATAPYRLRVRVWTPPGPFEFEPNDTWETATALPRGIAVAGHLGRDDTDVYRISAGPDDRLRVTVTPPSTVTPHLALFDDREREVARAAANAPGETLVLEAERALFAVVRPLGPGDPYATYQIQARGVTEPSR